jgi:hypothetical protein
MRKRNKGKGTKNYLDLGTFLNETFFELNGLGRC